MTTASFSPRRRGQVTSTGLTPATILTFTPVETNCILNVMARIIVRDTTNSASSSWVIAASFSNVAATMTQIGSNTVLDTKAEAGSTAVTPVVQATGSGGITVSGVSGQGGTTLLWDAEFDVMEYQFA